MVLLLRFSSLKHFSFYFWMYWIFLDAHIAVCGHSLAVSGAYSLVAVHGLLTAVASPVVEHRLQAYRLRSCSTWA